MPTGQPTLIVTAVWPEARPLIKRLGLRRDEGIFHGTRHDQNLEVIVTGIGPIQAKAGLSASLARMRPRRVLITGLAGALCETLRAGDLILPLEITGPDGTCHKPTWSCAGARGRLLSVDRTVMTGQEKAQLGQAHGAQAVDMESAALAQLCEKENIPWACARAISDEVQQDLPPNLETLVQPNGRTHWSSVGLWSLRHPRSLPDLVRLGLASRRAAEALAGRIVEML